MINKVGIIGSDGKIGKNLFIYFKLKGLNVTGFGRRYGNEIDYIYLNLEDNISVECQIKNFNVVIYCAGVTSFLSCMNYPEKSYKINVLSALNIFRICLKYNIKFIYISSNAVLPCNGNKFNLNNYGLPIGVYGLHKKIAEDLLLLNKEKVIIFRISKVMSINDEIFKKWVNLIKKNTKIDVFSDHFIAPISINDVCICLNYLVNNDIYGLFQLSGKENISYFELCKKFMLKNNYNSKYINPILTTPDFNRILDSTLDSQRILKLLHIDQPSLYSVLMI